MRVEVYNSTDHACLIRVTTINGATFEGPAEKAGEHNSFVCETGDALVLQVEATFSFGSTVDFVAPAGSGVHYAYYGVVVNQGAISVCALVF